MSLSHKGELLFTENKDEMLYRYGIVRGSREQINMIPKELVAGKEEGEFGCSALVKDKEKLIESGYLDAASSFGQTGAVIDRAGIEDILLYIVKTKESK